MEITLFEKFDLKYCLETESDIQYGNYEIVESLNIGEYNNEAIEVLDLSVNKGNKEK